MYNYPTSSVVTLESVLISLHLESRMDGMDGMDIPGLGVDGSHIKYY